MSALSISQRAPGVAQITMSRPALFNAFDEAMIAKPDAAFARLVAAEALAIGLVQQVVPLDRLDKRLPDWTAP